MLKRYRKLNKLFRNSLVLSQIRGKDTFTEAFQKELIDVIKKEVWKGNRFKEVIAILRKGIENTHAL